MLCARRRAAGCPASLAVGAGQRGIAAGAEDRARSVCRSGGADMKPIWIVLLCLLGAGGGGGVVLPCWRGKCACAAFFKGARPRAGGGGRPGRVGAATSCESRGWTADSEAGGRRLARVRRCRGPCRSSRTRICITPDRRACTRGSTASHAHATVILCHGYTATPSMISAPSSGAVRLRRLQPAAHRRARARPERGQVPHVRPARARASPSGCTGCASTRVQRPIALYGVSMGAASVLAAQLPELKGRACLRRGRLRLLQL